MSTWFGEHYCSSMMSTWFGEHYFSSMMSTWFGEHYFSSKMSTWFGEHYCSSKMSTWFGEHYCSSIPGDKQLQKTSGQRSENEEDILRQMLLCTQAIYFVVQYTYIQFVLYYLIIFIKF